MNKDNRFQFVNSEKYDNVIALDATMSDFSYSKHVHDGHSGSDTQLKYKML
mgnify:CR=1 FL=1